MTRSTEVLIRGGRVLDVATGECRRADVAVRAGVVVDAGSLEAPEVIDADGGTVLFGLWDCHDHPGSLMHDPTGEGYFETTASRAMRAVGNLQEALRAGVTGVRVLGETDQIDVALAAAVASGAVAGPRIMPSGLTLHTSGGHGHAYPREYLRMRYFDVVDGPVSVTRSVREHVQQGARWIKVCLTGGLYSIHEAVDDVQFDDEELEAAVRTARGRGVPVAAHCGSARVAERFARLGGRSIEHGYALDEAAAAAMAAAGTWLVPTIGVTHDEAMMVADGWPPHAIARAKASATRHAESLRLCIAAGVRIAVGADLNPVSTRLHREIALLEQAGMSRLQVLEAATAGGRELNGLGPSTTPTPGDAADLIIVDGDPLEDLGVLARPRAALVHGRVAFA